MKFPQSITQELKDTLANHPEIKEVYFDEQGKHHLTKFNLIVSRKDTTKKDFYQGELSHKQLIAGDWNTDGHKEDILKGVAGTEIVDTVSRQEIMDFEVKKEGQPTMVDMFLNSTPEDKAAFVAALQSMIGQTPAAAAVPTATITPKK